MNYFKNVKGVLDADLIRSNFYNLLWNYLYTYEWNNVYQYNFEHLMKYIIDNSSRFSKSITHVISIITYLVIQSG